MRLLSPSAVHVALDSRARLDLARADTRLRAEGWPGLAEVLYAATRRPSRNLRGEAARLGTRAAERCGRARRPADGLPLPGGEREEIEALISAAPEEVGIGLLRAICDSGVWIEQEAVAETVLRGEKADYNRK